MLRYLLTFLLMLGLTTAGVAQARLPGPQQNIPPSKLRDLQQVRASKVLRVLVNQSRNSSGEVKGEPVGIEYYRLSALEHYLNARAGDGQQIQLKLIPRAKEQLLGALQRGEGDLAAPGELLDPVVVRGVSSSAPVLDQVPLMLVGRKGERSFSHVEQLSGRTVALTSASAAGVVMAAIPAAVAVLSAVRDAVDGSAVIFNYGLAYARSEYGNATGMRAYASGYGDAYAFNSGDAVGPAASSSALA